MVPTGIGSAPQGTPSPFEIEKSPYSDLARATTRLEWAQTEKNKAPTLGFLK
jgi:hypothetical protein